MLAFMLFNALLIMVKLFGLSKMVWTIVFVAVQVVNFGFLVGAMDYDPWFHQYWSFDISGVSDYKFKGRLLKPSRDTAICDNDDYYKDCYDDCDTKCDRWKSWQDGGGTYVAFDTIGSIITVLNAALLVLDALNFKYFKVVINMFTTAILMVVIFVLHFLAYTIWAGTVKLKFSDCTHYILYSGTESVCGDGGAAFGLFIIFYLLIITPAYLFIAFKLRQEERNESKQSGQTDPLQSRE